MILALHCALGNERHQRADPAAKGSEDQPAGSLQRQMRVINHRSDNSHRFYSARRMRLLLLTLIVSAALNLVLGALLGAAARSGAEQTSVLVFPGKDGKLQYKADANGNTITQGSSANLRISTNNVTNYSILVGPDPSEMTHDFVGGHAKVHSGRRAPNEVPLSCGTGRPRSIWTPSLSSGRPGPTA